MDAFTRFTNQTQGRDRLFRAVQYSCMLLRSLLEPRAGREEAVAKLKDLEASVSAGRKWFRLGNVVHALQATQQSLQAAELVPCLCLTLAHLNRAVYFVCDTVLWARSVGLAPSVDREQWRLRAARHYACALLLSLARDLYELALQAEQVARERARRRREPGACSVADEEPEWLQSLLLLLLRALRRHPPLLLDTLRNLCDLLIPLDQLGICRSGPGVIGLGGLVSSVAGMLAVAYPDLKLKTR